MKPVKYLALFGFVTATIAGALIATQSSVALSVEAATVAEEPTGPLHLETSKVKSFSDFHFETMEGPSGDTITTYYFAAGSEEKANPPEVRFTTEGTDTSAGTRVAVDTIEVHFWYKLSNASEKSLGDPDKPYMIQIVNSAGGYNAVTWEPVNDGQWHVTKFATGEYHDKFAGFVLKAGDMNGTLVVADIRTYKTAVTDLETVFPESFNMNFSYDYIDNGFFDIPLTERIFTTTAYINDHYGEFLDVDNNVIPLRDGIVINGKTLKEWIDYVPEIITYPRNDGVTCFPVRAGSQFNPISIEAAATTLSFKFSLEEIPLDSVVVTFKAGLFYGYYNNTTFTLDKDITYYANVTTSNGPTRIVFSKTPSWVKTHLGVSHFEDWGEQTASQGGKYHRWLMVTNILRDTTNITQGCPADNYRYMYDNVLMNGKPITYYNAWARGNSKDFTDLADPSTQNPAYELGHPTGSANTRYDLAIRIEVITDQARYFLCFSVPNQLLVDLNMVGNPTFTLRDGSAWLSIVDDQSKVVRYDAAEAVDAKIEAIGTVSLSSEDAISEARAAYEALSADGKSRVTKLSVLEAAEARLAELKTAKAAAEAVDAKIEAIGTVSLDSEAAINEARAAYEALSADGKSCVTKLSVLEAAEARLVELQELADAIDDAKVELSNYPDMGLYRSGDQDTIQSIIDNAWAQLDRAESIDEVNDIVAGNKELIDAVPTDAQRTAQELEEYKAEKKAYLDEMKEELLPSYRTAEQQMIIAGVAQGKSQIDNATTFTEVDEIVNGLYSQLSDLKTADKYDQEEATVVYDAINAIPELTPANYLDYAQDIINARILYDDLTDGGKARVRNYSDLVALEARFAELAQEKQNAEAVEALINQIGDVNSTQACLNRINAAQDAYNALNAEEKSMVTNVETLNSAVSNFATALDLSKQAALADIDEFLSGINMKKYSKDNQAAIEELAASAKENVRAQTYSDNLAQIVADFEAAVNEIPQKKAPKKGCGGSIVATSVVLSTLALAGLGLAISRKRKED